MLVEVAVAAAVRGTFTYSVPPAMEALASLGRRVAVPFGKSHRATGYVVGHPQQAPDGVALRDVLEVLDEFPLFTPEVVKLVRWAEDYYLVPPGELLRAALPPGLNARRGARGPERRGVEFAAPRAGAQDALAALARRAKAQHAVLEYLLARGRIPVEELRAAFPAGRTALVALVKRGLAELHTESRHVSGSTLPAGANALALSSAQRAALDAVTGALGTFATYLLHGITGSGKTEVYLQAIAHARASGRGALVLVPEIALTPQLAGRFRARFGDDVALLHSGLTPPERHAEWLRLRHGEARICVGVRSAIFAPVQDLAVIVVDEEHDPSFKQEDGPAYQARDLAVVRARSEGAVCVLGSATPSLESLENARRGKYRLLELPARIDDRPLPSVEVVDLAKARRGPRPFGLLSPTLLAALEDTLRRDQQSILFLNRRGFETLVLCEACGREERCPDCAVSLTFHRRRGVLLCHYCGRTQRPDPACPGCGGPRRGLGVGTEQVEAAVREALPTARVARLDRDSVSGAGDVAEVLARFARRETDVLVGTQMVTKGHDFPGVTLVGVVLADTALSMPDFRAAERTFQLLTQVSGRAGRGSEPGKVVIQTYNPHSAAIACAVSHDYARFAEDELATRAAHGFPPFARLMAVRIEGTDSGAGRAAESLAEAAGRVLTPESGISMLGPAPAPLEKLRGRSRWQILFRAPDAPRLRRVHAVLAGAVQRLGPGADVRFDMDPQSML